jgi:uncharacterized protein YjbJ (UPF0337 family)
MATRSMLAIRRRWGRLTDADLALIEGRAGELVGVLQQRYGLTRERAERDCRAFLEPSELKAGAPQRGD